MIIDFRNIRLPCLTINREKIIFGISDTNSNRYQRLDAQSANLEVKMAILADWVKLSRYGLQLGSPFKEFTQLIDKIASTDYGTNSSDGDDGTQSTLFKNA